MNMNRKQNQEQQIVEREKYLEVGELVTYICSIIIHMTTNYRADFRRNHAMAETADQKELLLL